MQFYAFSVLFMGETGNKASNDNITFNLKNPKTKTFKMHQNLVLLHSVVHSLQAANKQGGTHKQKTCKQIVEKSEILGCIKTNLRLKMRISDKPPAKKTCQKGIEECIF